MKPPICVCWGCGVDSTAMLIEMHRRGIRPDLITLADTGGEKRGTYEFLPIFSRWLVEHDFPEPTVCRYQPKRPTAERYLQATQDAVISADVLMTNSDTRRLAGLYGNMVANSTLPGLAFGMKSCSVKWKLEAQEPT